MTNPYGETARLAAARGGDQHEFGDLTEPYRRELQIHCYRILGSLHDAEDLVQETFLRAWRRLDTFEGRSSFRAWLYKIATNACLDTLDRQRTLRRALPSTARPADDPQARPQPPVAELVWLEPLPDEWLVDPSASPEARYSARESISLAFLAALQLLPPRQRAVLILGDVLDWRASEIAELLEMTTSAVNSALHRARVALARQYHAGGRGSLPSQPADERMRALLDQYVQAWEAADVARLVALLSEDARFTMPPSPSWYEGRPAIAVFVAATIFAEEAVFQGAASGRWRLRPTRANGQFAFATYQREASGIYRPFGLQVLTFEGEELAAMDHFIDPELFSLFGLPKEVW
jgi:RNA polymerase sigma-70 factor (ECF subfamily)